MEMTPIRIPLRPNLNSTKVPSMASIDSTITMVASSEFPCLMKMIDSHAQMSMYKRSVK